MKNIYISASELKKMATSIRAQTDTNTQTPVNQPVTPYEINKAIEDLKTGRTAWIRKEVANNKQVLQAAYNFVGRHLARGWTIDKTEMQKIHDEFKNTKNPQPRLSMREDLDKLFDGKITKNMNQIKSKFLPIAVEEALKNLKANTVYMVERINDNFDGKVIQDPTIITMAEEKAKTYLTKQSESKNIKSQGWLRLFDQLNYIFDGKFNNLMPDESTDRTIIE